MVTIFKKIKQLFKKKELESTNLSTGELESFELDVDWSDISLGNNSNYIANAMKRNGIHGRATNSMVVLEDGSEYIPEQLSVHWEGYNNSPKFKPKKIVYNLLKMQ
jgi:hypothetical protein